MREAGRRIAVCVVMMAMGGLLAQEMIPSAILPFEERGQEVRGMGRQVSDLLFVSLAEKPEIMLVDREDMKKTLDEAELNISGAVNPNQATQVGQLTGAKLIITGSVMEIGKKLYIVGKIIGTETTRVMGASVNGAFTEDLDAMTAELGNKIASIIKEDSQKLVAEKVAPEALVKTLNEKMGDAKRPVLFIEVTERHVGQQTIDPAAQTEFALLSKQTGFAVLDEKSATSAKADILIRGEGFSEFATRRGNLVSVKARLEVTAVDTKTDKVIAVDRQTSVVVDLTEQIAGKAALQDAARKIAARMLPRLVK